MMATKNYEESYRAKCNGSDRDRIADMVILAYSFDVLLKDMNGSKTFKVTGLPSDAEWIGTYYDHVRQSFRVRYRHASFMLVPPGTEVPLMYPMPEIVARRIDNTDHDMVSREPIAFRPR